MAGSFQSGSLDLKKVGQRMAVAHISGVHWWFVLAGFSLGSKFEGHFRSTKTKIIVGSHFVAPTLGDFCEKSQ